MVLFGSQVISLRVISYSGCLGQLIVLCVRARVTLQEMFAALFCFLFSIAGELGQSPIQSNEATANLWKHGLISCVYH